MSSVKNYKKCFVDDCVQKNSYKFTVPAKFRVEFLAICTEKEHPDSKALFICEDHFDVEKDVYTNSLGQKRLAYGALPSRAIKRKKTAEIEGFNVGNGSVIDLETEKILTETIDLDFDEIEEAALESLQNNVQVQEDHEDDSRESEMVGDFIMNDSSDSRDESENCSSEDSEDDWSDEEPSEEESGDVNSDNGDEEFGSKNIDIKTCNSIEEYTMKLFESDPLFYLGILPENIEFVKILSKGTNISVRNIYIVLFKIRQNETFKSIGDRFGLSQGRISQIFKTNVEQIAVNLQLFIINPSVEKIKKNLPLSFQHRYKNVTHLIDCMEIPIEKPYNAQYQVLTWSQYYSDNTAKILVSSTPDGTINFISRAYGGRITDERIVRESKFIEFLHPDSVVMADRGFKGVEKLLPDNCFIRPPSVINKQKQSKDIATSAKIIASLRINIERVIRKLRGFKIISKYAQVPNTMRKYINFFIIIAAGLSNVNKPLIMGS